MDSRCLSQTINCMLSNVELNDKNEVCSYNCFIFLAYVLQMLPTCFGCSLDFWVFSGCDEFVIT